MRIPASAPVVLTLAAAGLGLFAGCASEDGARLPSALASRWTPPLFATRTVDAVDVRAVTAACKQAATGGGFAVQRFDAVGGVVSAVRRQTSAFDGARQDTLEIRVSASAPGLVQVAVVLREVVESASGDGRSAPMVTAALVRDRVAYDAFFDRLNALWPAR
jgi:GTP cyclohydrolase III